ncbi:MAG: hypothetical protein L6Q47_11365 [Ignavibacteriaceae bacterium]|nr:hypothetical protein [Ignavibacteriaceae bacterium]
MKPDFIEEPLLLFGRGKSICPRDGIARFDVYDTLNTIRKDQMSIGAIGIEEDIYKLNLWLQKIQYNINSFKSGRQRGLFPPFPGFNVEKAFCSRLIYDSERERVLSLTDVNLVIKIPNRNERLTSAVELFGENIAFLSDMKNCDVIICIIPKIFENTIVKTEEEESELEISPEINNSHEPSLNFRSALKAKAMKLNIPIQIMREYVLQESNKSQDSATKAWNFSIAMYYKGLKTIPWKLETDENKPKVCFVGIGFYKSLDGNSIQTSISQIFNENGKGVILRGTPVEEDKIDKRPHLSFDQSFELLDSTLKKYKFVIGSLPGRVVLHKTSKFYNDELDGFIKAFYSFGITEFDIVTILDTDIRLFRDNLYPPVRGLMFSLSEKRHILYTRGSVPYYQTYPGMYIPAPIELRIVKSVSSHRTVCKEILGLTKMNWNNTQFDNKYPITIACARRVGEIMKYLGEHDTPKESYAFYM